MFTGIIQQVGRIRHIERTGEDLSLTVEAPGFRSRHDAGDSIAVNGVCLTLLDEADDLRFDVSVETLSRTLIGEYSVGQAVNLEAALLPTTPLGGHLVSGHVDGVATVDRLEPSARSTVFEFVAGRRFARFIAEKGSVCIDGISLTVNTVVDTEDTVRLSVNIVPHTLSHTNLSARQAGDRVHLEIDLVARYLARIQDLA
ncbi:MAG: riboflavin synthase [Proteobacteria bacterium]|nr:MAG: riboflavin synthase [Pseudomonadota bacterium]